MRTTKTGHGKIVHVGGRHRPIATAKTHPHLFRSVRKYMGGASLPAAPDSFSYFDASAAAQADILGNDTLGDCTAAGACHIVECVNGAAGNTVVLQRADAVRFYSLSTGYDPSNPNSDQGGDEIICCSTWRDKGLDGNGAHAIIGWVAIDPTDAVLVKSCAWVFENLYFGMELDSGWPGRVNGNGYVWDGGTPNPSDGHCVIGGGADLSGVKINSWGDIGTITYPTIARYCADAAGGNLFAILTQEILGRAQQKTPSGFDWSTMLADFAVIGGVVPPAPPTASC